MFYGDTHIRHFPHMGLRENGFLIWIEKSTSKKYGHHNQVKQN